MEQDTLRTTSCLRFPIDLESGKVSFYKESTVKTACLLPECTSRSNLKGTLRIPNTNCCTVKENLAVLGGRSHDPTCDPTDGATVRSESAKDTDVQPDLFLLHINILPTNTLPLPSCSFHLRRQRCSHRRFLSPCSTLAFTFTINTLE